MKHRLVYLLAAVLLWMVPLALVAGMYFGSKQPICPPNWQTLVICFWLGYLGPPIAFAPMGITVVLLSFWLLHQAFKKN